jgi:hypothetical protein
MDNEEFCVRLDGGRQKAKFLYDVTNVHSKNLKMPDRKQKRQ